MKVNDILGLKVKTIWKSDINQLRYMKDCELDIEQDETTVVSHPKHFEH